MKGGISMVIFINNKLGTVAIPFERIYQIEQQKNKILISYHGGEFTWLDEEKFVPSVNHEDIIFENEQLANTQMRYFYKACESNKGAFFFG